MSSNSTPITTATTTEVWTDIPGYEGLYQISNLDQVRSLPRVVATRSVGLRTTNLKIKVPVQDQRGYLGYNLWKEGKGKSWSLHQLKLLTFVGPCPDGMECRHLNGNGFDNRLDNLAYGSHLENIRDKQRHGTAKLGAGSTHKLKNATALVRELWQSGRFKTKTHLAKHLNVTLSAICYHLGRKPSKTKGKITCHDPSS